ncbi:hypothetical protein [Pseudomonas sp. S2_F03]
MKKVLLLVIALATSMMLPVSSYAAEDTYICRVTNTQPPGSNTVTASSSNEAVEKAKKQLDSVK